MTEKYYPEPVPYTDDLPYIREFLFREFLRISASFEGVREIELEKLSTEPTPREGMIKFADGVNWNPGSGAGLYFYNGTSWIMLSPGFTEGTWTPSFTFQTPGDQVITHTTQNGTYQKIGKMVRARFTVTATTVTHTTAAGAFRILGLPFPAAAGMEQSGHVEWGGITLPGGRTQLAVNVQSSQSLLRFVASPPRFQITAAEVPSGGAVTAIGTIVYEATS